MNQFTFEGKQKRVLIGMMMLGRCLSWRLPFLTIQSLTIQGFGPTFCITRSSLPASHLFHYVYYDRDLSQLMQDGLLFLKEFGKPILNF